MEVNLVSVALIVTANPEMALPVILKKTSIANIARENYSAYMHSGHHS